MPPGRAKWKGFQIAGPIIFNYSGNSLYLNRNLINSFNEVFFE